MIFSRASLTTPPRFKAEAPLIADRLTCNFLKPDLATTPPDVCFLALLPLFTRAMASQLETNNLTKPMKKYVVFSSKILLHHFHGFLLVQSFLHDNNSTLSEQLQIVKRFWRVANVHLRFHRFHIPKSVIEIVIIFHINPLVLCSYVLCWHHRLADSQCVFLALRHHSHNRVLTHGGHLCIGVRQPWAHDVGTREDELDGTLVHPLVGQNEWVLVQQLQRRAPRTLPLSEKEKISSSIDLFIEKKNIVSKTIMTL